VICEDKRIDETYTCGPTTDTKVCYPKTTPSGLTKLPVVFYNRDSWGWGGGPDYRAGTISWLTEMAEQCLIVIAPMTPQKDTTPTNDDKCKRDHDLLLAYNYIKIPENWSGKGSNRWNILRVTPDWESVGAAGQSSGAHHLPWFQREFGEERVNESDKKTKKLKAVLYGHGGGTQKEGKMRTDLPKCLADTKWCDGVPAFFLTSTDDTQVHPSGTYGWYQKLTGQDTAGGKPHVQHVVYAQVKQLTNDPPQWGHMEPVTPHSYHGGEYGGGYGVLNTYTAKFMACHLYSDTNQANIHEEACAWIYGSSDGSRGNICETASSLVDPVGPYKNKKIKGCYFTQPN